MWHTVTTLDALHTQTKLAYQILAQGGDYLMVVKENQPLLYQAIAETFAALPPRSVHDQEDWGYNSNNYGVGTGRLRMLPITFEMFPGAKTILHTQALAP